MPKLQDLTGQTFGEWEVLGRAANRPGGTLFVCRCKQCNRVYEVWGTDLRRGKSLKCTSCSSTGRPCSKEARKKRSESELGDKNHRYGKTPAHTKGSWYDSVRNGPIWMRSTYESRFCQRADDLCYSYDWEPEAFPLEVEGTKTTYRPDVFVRDLNLWIEIKGYWRPLAIAKFAAFLVRYPEERIVVMTIDELNRFEQGESLEQIYKEEF